MRIPEQKRSNSRAKETVDFLLDRSRIFFN